MGSVVFNSVTKRFGHTVAVDDVSFDVSDGEFVVLVGPSGSGKTTALRLLGGLESITEGEIQIDGRVVNEVAPRDRGIAMVFQDYALYPQMTVYDNLAFGLRTRRLSKPEIKVRIDAAAHALDLAALLGRKPRQLSGGQRQRVALGRALVRRPSVFLMDEPLSNLDANLRIQMRGEIKRLQRETGTTTVYVTHDQVEAMTMGDRILVLRDGALEQIAPPDGLYQKPASAFVAGFIGSPGMSLVLARAIRDTHGVSLDLAGTKLPGGGLSITDETVRLGVRPEDAVLWPYTGERCYGPLQGRVEFVEDLGRESLIGVCAGEAHFVLSCPGRTAVALDEKVTFGIRKERVYAFHTSTGACLGLL